MVKQKTKLNTNLKNDYHNHLYSLFSTSYIHFNKLRTISQMQNFVTLSSSHLNPKKGKYSKSWLKKMKKIQQLQRVDVFIKEGPFR